MTVRASRSNIVLIESSEFYFKELVSQGLSKRKLKVVPVVENYLVHLLNHYLDARNLFDQDQVREDGTKNPQSLAEAYLLAQSADATTKTQMLRKLADRTLYVSGFFGDSLSRKVIDIDYYANIGGSSYATLASISREDALSKVYEVFSKRFLDFVDVLTYISEQSAIQTDQSILRLYDRYVRTGSELAKEKLVELGVPLLPKDQVKLGKPS